MKKEIDGWLVKKDFDGKYLFDNPINPKDYYMVALIKNFVLECSFLKEDYDTLKEEERDSWLEHKLKTAILEYGKGPPWMR